MIPKDELEELVLSEIWDRLLNPKVYPILIDDLNKQVNAQINKNHSLIDALQSEEKSLLKKLDAFYNGIEETGHIDPFDRERMQQTKDRITTRS